MNMQVKSKDVFVEIKYDELKNLITKATQRDMLIRFLKDEKKYNGIVKTMTRGEDEEKMQDM